MVCHREHGILSGIFASPYNNSEIMQLTYLQSSPPESAPNASAASTNSACRPARNGTPSSCQLPSILSLKRSFDDLTVFHSFLYETSF